MYWWVWLIVAFVLGIVELTTFTFVLLWIAVGALITAALTSTIPEMWAQIVLFAVVSIVLVVATRPLARKWRRGRSFPTLSEQVAHRTATVVKPPVNGKYGTVRVGGELWSAVSDEELVQGQTVLVVTASSAVLKVRPLDSSEVKTNNEV